MIKVKIFIIYVYLLVKAISIWYLTIRGLGRVVQSWVKITQG